MTLYWLDTGWACGGVYVLDGIIVQGGAPIFRRLNGQRLADVLRRSRYGAAIAVPGLADRIVVMVNE